ncbi:MAG: ATP-dependent DNA helicase RecG [Candidatus Dormibacteraeota bacterium]|uniref:ATP-dependent DNA helicase RecG n=1 Tax=Candidatus Aeolococcus gillhamiae TaxID=3127015 RepID=A0A2W6AXU3_9BACT|nr:ATP-dependent DNA helicase RecG [Candidatus Dormibacteraeota bacterium]PZR82791.1 MAG: DNA helicase RecG [Candidatus Dormibacter sp. RRmetagenome_bin12]
MASPSTTARLAAISPSTSVLELPGVKDMIALRLDRLGITTVRDLLFHMPRRYEDTRVLTPVAQLRAGEVQTSQVVIRNVTVHRSHVKKIWLVEASLVDGRDVVGAVWFNQRFLMNQLRSGMEVLVSGKVETSRTGLTFRNPTFERVGSEQRHVGRLAPVYPETEKLSSARLRSLIEPLLPLADSLPDRLPSEVRSAEHLMGIGTALRQVHFPDDEQSRARAHERIAFEELFLLQLAAQRARRRRLSSAGVAIPYDVEVARAFAGSLPFQLTEGQRVAAHQVLTDMAGSGSMNRLLQGDVGSGKTVVAAMAALMAHRAGFQVAVMAPTEILARQHQATLTQMLAAHDLAPRLLVGSTPARARREIVEAMANGRESLLVGTHALIEDDVVFSDLGLVVVDEQHRFGVAQRQRLRRKGALMPNFLAMTATPIPRSLSLTVYGDVNISELREMPPGRHPVATRVVPPYQRDEAYAFIREQIGAGRQAFVICPLIEENDKLGVRSATAEHERLRDDVFPDLRVELLHGRMPSREKEERMGRFARGDADLLVATSVIEVGVDVPNATILVIEGAERFGLAQLHQFRGRVGRDRHRSYCILFQSSIDDEGSQRLETVAATHSGFDLAEADLRLRGAGDVAGLRQHGLPEMLAADLLDVAMLQRARAAAEAWLDHDPELTSYAPLHEAMTGYRAVFDLD